MPASRSSSTSSTTTPPRATISARRCRSAASTIASYYRLQRRPALLSGRHRHRQHAEHRSSARAADGDGLAALLGRRRCMSTASASTLRRRLARENGDYSQGAAFFDAIRQDPAMSQVKLIAEPWDVGPYGYQLGNFPPGWAEWNGQYRDAVRRFWSGDEGIVAEMASRVAGSSDIFGYRGRRPWASINFVTAHDGFTLQDLVSYERQAQRGQRRGQPRRARREFQLELRRRGPDRRSRDRRAARPPEAQPDRDAAAVARACRCCSPATRSAGRSRATTTPIARTTRSPGSTGSNIRPEDEALRNFVRHLIRAAAAAPGLLAAALLPRRGGVAKRAQGHHLGHPGRGRGDRRRIGATRSRARSAMCWAARPASSTRPGGQRDIDESFLS